MGLIDPSIILQGGQNSLGQGFGQGLGFTQQLMQMQQAKAQQAQAAAQQAQSERARQAFTQAAQGEDITKPEGMGNAIRKFAQAGFPNEASAVLEAHKDMFPQPKAKDNKFKSLWTTGGAVSFEEGTGKYYGNDGREIDPSTLEMPPMMMERMDPLGQAKLDEEKRHNLAMEKNGSTDKSLKANNIFNQEQQLRTQYLGQTKDFRDVRDAYGRIQAAAKDPSAAGDLALIFNYMKILDPGSTVREGEFANAQNATGVPERILNAYNKAISGERLNAAQRTDFLNRSKALYSKAEFQKNKTQSGYRKLAAQYPGLNPDRILMDDNAVEEPAPPDTGTAPAVAQPKSKAERDALPAGTKYIGPDGKVAVKQ